MMTADSSAQEHQRGLKAGVREVLQKPVALRKIRELIDNIAKAS